MSDLEGAATADGDELPLLDAVPKRTPPLCEPCRPVGLTPALPPVGAGGVVIMALLFAQAVPITTLPDAAVGRGDA